MTTGKRLILSAAATAMLLCASCGAPAAPAAGSTEPPKVTAKELWSLKDEKAINNPESVWYDEARKCIWVVNTTDSATKDSFVSKLSLDGKVLEPMVVGEMVGLRGTYVQGDYLYTNQLTALTKINLTTGKVEATYPVPEAKQLNDIAMDSKGTIYITDLQGDTIYKLEGDKLVPWLTDKEALEWPNGIRIINDVMYETPWGIGDENWEVTYQSTVKTIDLTSKEVKPLGSADKIGSLDGVEQYDADNLLVNNWWEGKVYLVNMNSGKSSLILETGLKSCGDINYNQATKTLLLPIGNAAEGESHQIKAYQLS